MSSQKKPQRFKVRLDSNALLNDIVCIVQPALEKMLGINEARIVQQIWYWSRHNYSHKRLGEIKVRMYHGRKYVCVPPAYFDDDFLGVFGAWHPATKERALKGATDAGVLRIEKLGGPYNMNWYCVYADHIEVLYAIYEQFCAQVESEFLAASTNPKSKKQTLPPDRSKAIWDNCRRHLEAAKQQCLERLTKETQTQNAENAESEEVTYSEELVDFEIENFFEFLQIAGTDEDGEGNSPQIAESVPAESGTSPRDLQEDVSANRGGSSRNLQELSPLIVSKEQQQREFKEESKEQLSSSALNFSTVTTALEAGESRENSHGVTNEAAPPAGDRENLDEPESVEEKERRVRAELSLEYPPEIADALITHFGVGRVLFALDLDELDNLVAQLPQKQQAPQAEATRPRVAAVFHADLTQQVLIEYAQARYNPMSDIEKFLEEHGAHAMHIHFEWARATIAKKPQSQQQEDSVARLLKSSFKPGDGRDRYGPIFENPALRQNLASETAAELLKKSRETAATLKETRETSPTPNNGSQAPKTAPVDDERARRAKLWDAASLELRAHAEEDAMFVLRWDRVIDPKILLLQAQASLEERLARDAQRANQSESESAFDEDDAAENGGKEEAA